MLRRRCLHYISFSGIRGTLFPITSWGRAYALPQKNVTALRSYFRNYLDDPNSPPNRNSIRTGTQNVVSGIEGTNYPSAARLDPLYPRNLLIRPSEEHIPSLSHMSLISDWPNPTNVHLVQKLQRTIVIG